MEIHSIGFQDYLILEEQVKVDGKLFFGRTYGVTLRLTLILRDKKVVCINAFYN